MTYIKKQVPIKINYWGETAEDYANLPTLTTEGKGEYFGMGCAPENAIAFILYTTGLRFYQLNINGWVDITADILNEASGSGSGSGDGTFDIDTLTSEQIERLKEIINDNDYDLDNLTPEQINRLKVIINDNDFDMDIMTPEQIERFKELLGLSDSDIPVMSDEQVNELVQILNK